ncbi:MAG: sugar ABC transporter permease [Alphaproteobacteria bacterium]|nr:sugar ABC transporter permease [Alphaproteobacteria bacterium]
MATSASKLQYVASKRQMRGWKTAIIFVSPAIALFTLFIILPIIEAAGYSVFNWNGLGLPSPDRFVGTDNFERLARNKVFARAFNNNMLLIAASLFVQLPIALAMAALLAERRLGTITFRMIFFLPFILADIAAGLIWRFIFDGNNGLVSHASQAMGGDAIFLLADREYAFVAVLVAVVWKYFGFHMMLYIAGMQAIDKSLYEAASIDGANAWHRFRYVTLPGIMPTIRLSVFFSLLGALQLFDLVVPLTGGNPLNKTHTMVSFLYYFGIGRMKVGFGAATGVALFIICVVVAFSYKKWVMKDD